MLGSNARWSGSPSANMPISPPSPSLSIQADTTTSPVHSPADLQSHLYSSFLEGSTADVALHVRGSWEAIYKLHRVVLIQAGFFRPMFTAGFSESRFKNRGRRYGPEQIDIIFDDPNITRPAFEVCISRLYGGGPPVHISPSLIPTPLHPLTISFPELAPREELPPGHHPASPRFLLSLLATAVYLSIPSVAGQALKSILNTVGPTTVMRYLRFAIGKGIGPVEDGDPEAAVGVEGVAEIKHNDTSSSLDGASVASRTFNNHLSEASNETKQEDPAESINSDWDEVGLRNEPELPYFYGGISNKVGEAAACWLARWGGDILPYEEASLSPPQSLPVPSGSKSQTNVVPFIWARGGLDAVWVRALLSSDLVFVKGERERYDMAKAVVELRRSGGIDEVEEMEFSQLFIYGIHYMHMSMEDLMAISRDVSPTTNRPFVPLSCLRAALWDQSILRHQITSHLPREKELGIAIPTAEIPTLDDPALREDKSKPYYPLPYDSSERIGDSTGIEGATMEQLFRGIPQDLNRAIPAPTSERNFFGLLAERQTKTTCIETDKSGKLKWSPYPPFRFAVEFWDVELLKEKTRMHSHTVWYAGSLYNAYVQVIRKKGVQLGVYLHRQSHIDPLPPFSVPHFQRGEQNKMHHRSLLTSTLHNSSLLSTANPSLITLYRSITPVSTHTIPSSPKATSLQPAKSSNSPVPYPPQPYRDPRSSISAYFSISCCSATGSSITRFTSGPDVFAISQSWGWKSSSLKTEEYLELDEDGLPVPVAEGTMAGKEVSLRATVVVGIV